MSNVDTRGNICVVTNDRRSYSEPAGGFFFHPLCWNKKTVLFLCLAHDGRSGMFRHRQNIKREEGETKLCAYIGILNDALHPRVPYIIRKEEGAAGGYNNNEY